jgi:predicted RNA binding protein YcfA (HicA-like mRNA interferase family)
MPKIPRITSKKLIKSLLKNGYYIDHQTWSHIIFYKNDFNNVIVVPNHNKDLKIWTLKNILKQAKLTTDDLIEMLK